MEKPRAAAALNLLGAIELQQGHLLQSIALIDRAISIEPTSAAFHCNRGVALQDLKQYEEAIASYDRALALRANLPEVLNNRGAALRALGRPGEAMDSYERALKIRADYAEAHNNRGNVLRDMKRNDEALAAYARALTAKPEYLEPRRNRADLFQQLVRLKEALAESDLLLIRAPQDAAAHRQRGLILQQMGRNDEAIAAFRQAILAKPDYARAYNNLANRLAEQGEVDAAIAQYERALQLEPDFFEAHFNLGKLFFSRQRYEDAVEHFQRAAAIMPNSVEALVHFGEALLEIGHADEALATAEAAAQLPQHEGFPHYALGVFYARCGRAEAAEQHLRQYLTEDSSDSLGARLILAKLGRIPVPDRASESQIRRLYRDRSSHWSGKGYRGHRMIADALQQMLSGPAASLDILDAGCGTGLLAEYLRRFARRLEGVDLSAAMLQAARTVNMYDAVFEAELAAFLLQRSAAYDAIAAAAVLIHFGDLHPVMIAAAHALRPDGLFLFTFFPNETTGRGFDVAPLGFAEGGCFVHSQTYVEQVARDAGFAISLIQYGIHELDNHGHPIPAQVVVLRKTVAG